MVSISISASVSVSNSSYIITGLKEFGQKNESYRFTIFATQRNVLIEHQAYSALIFNGPVYTLFRNDREEIMYNLSIIWNSHAASPASLPEAI